MDSSSGPPPLPADFSFTFDPSLAPWNHPKATWISLNSKSIDGLNSKPLDGLVGSAVVFHPVTNRILLIQRAHHNSGALAWEIPGGGIENNDPSFLHGAARELFEEAGLRARHIKRVIVEKEGESPGHTWGPDGWTFVTSRGLVCRGYAFEMDVSLEDMEGGVKLDPNEHEDYVWATEEEVKAGAVGDKKIPLVSPRMLNLILGAFQLRNDNGEWAA